MKVMPSVLDDLSNWQRIIRRAQQTSAGTTAVHVSGLSVLARQGRQLPRRPGRDRVLRPEDTEFVADPSPQYRRTQPGARV